MKLKFRHLQAKQYERSLFDHPSAQQMIALEKLNPHDFLFAAAIDPFREADFDFFLSHPLCSVEALNERAQTLEQWIQVQADSVLSPEIKAARIAKIKAHSKHLRTQRTAEYLGFNLSALKPISAQFPEALLPAAREPGWSFEGIEPTEVQRFQQLIAWLKVQEPLSSQRTAFEALERNQAIRQAIVFNAVLEDLETFVAYLNTYLKDLKAEPSDAEKQQQAKKLASHLDACDQLGFCAAGVRSALQSMTRSLNPNALVLNAVDVTVDQSTKHWAHLLGVKPRNEVHLSKDRILRLLGMDSSLSYDPHRLAMTKPYLDAITQDAAARLSPEYLCENLPSLESTPPSLEEKELLFNEELFNVLERDWKSLASAGLLPEEENSRKKWVALICFISDLTPEAAERLLEEYENANMSQPLTLTLTTEKLKSRYRAVLERTGLLSLSETKQKNLNDQIWRLLSTADFSKPEENGFWKNLIQAPNGPNWIKSVIEAHKTEWDQIKLAALLHCPAESSQSLLNAFASDPFLGTWMMGVEITQEGNTFAFKKAEEQALATALRALDEDSMHKTLEKTLFAPGNLFFWLAVFQQDESRKSIATSLLSFLSGEELWKYDSLPQVLDRMIKLGSDEQKVVAQSFLENRLQEQKELTLWECYWKTACYLPKYQLNFETPEMLLSLKDPLNARAALYLAGSQEALMAQLNKAAKSFSTTPTGQTHWDRNLREITQIINGLYPVAECKSASTQPPEAITDKNAEEKRSERRFSR